MNTMGASGFAVNDVNELPFVEPNRFIASIDLPDKRARFVETNANHYLK